MMARHSFRSKKHKTKNDELPTGNPICEAGLAMHKDGKMTDNGRTRQKYCCPFRQSKTGACPCNHKNWNNGKRNRGCRPFPQTTGFPLTAAVSISNEHMLCGQSVSAIIPASNLRGRNGCRYATAQVRQNSIHWHISLHWRLPWPLFCLVRTPAAQQNPSDGLPDHPQYCLSQSRLSAGTGFCTPFSGHSAFLPC